MLRITSLPAKEGDAIWIRWGDDDDLKNIIIDMGTEAIGRDLRTRLEALPEEQRKLELLIVSHVDRDHIGGVLTCLAEADPLPGLDIDDVWFNGFQHLSGGKISTTPSTLEAQGAAQGERLTKWLRKQRWNRAFDGGPVERKSDEVTTIEIDDDLSVTIVGPTRERLEAFIETWEEEVEAAIEKGSLDLTDISPGLESMGSKNPPILELSEDLEILAESKIGNDSSHANGSSIAVLLEYKERKILLSGDAFSDDLIDGINSISYDRLQLDIFKLPHHGSRNNVHKELIEAVDCDRWLISSDGTRFRHPDAEAIARVISFSTNDKPLLSFNAPSKFNCWWDNDDWKVLYGYEAEYGDSIDGISFEFD
jgi:hypothetical protein